jgi:uncharacterized protein (TIGR02466 family)
MQNIKLNQADVFAIPVYMSEYPNAEKDKDNIISLARNIEKTSKEHTYTGKGFTNYNYSSNFLDDPVCADFISNTVQNIHNSLGMKFRVSHACSWVTIGRQYSHHGRHNHLPAVWSGVYYVQAEEDDANIIFYDKNKDSNWPWEFADTDNKYTALSARGAPGTGVLYVFPSYLDHSVEEQLKDRERVTISFNYAVGPNEG